MQAGDRVVAGEIIAVVEDTHGFVNNALAEAEIALENARLTQSQTLLTLDQSLESARIAYEKARRDQTNATIANTNGTDKSKADLDYENFLTLQQITLE